MSTIHTKAYMSFSSVNVQLRDGIATVTVNRPDVLNALDETVIEQLHEAFRRTAADRQVRGIIIAGAGKAFVVGADIGLFLRCLESGNLERIYNVIRAATELLTDIDRCLKPVVACVHGAALGGGLELALACDRIIASPKATLAFPETGLGVFPSGGGTQRTPRKIGVGLAKWLLFTGHMLSPKDAQAIGLVDRVVPHQDIEAAAVGLILNGSPPERIGSRPERFEVLEKFFRCNRVDALRTGAVDTDGDERLLRVMRRVASKAPIALRITERLVDEGIKRPLDEGLRMELDHVLEIYRTHDAYEGLRFSVEKKIPVFQGQ